MPMVWFVLNLINDDFYLCLCQITCVSVCEVGGGGGVKVIAAEEQIIIMPAPGLAL